MTTRSTFEKVAAVLAGERALGVPIDNATKSLADVFAQENPRFDRARFYAAAGIPQEG